MKYPTTFLIRYIKSYGKFQAFGIFIPGHLSNFKPIINAVFMKQFDNVSVIKKANIYFDGGVTSRTIHLDNGEVKTLGIMLPGKYEFNTDKEEIMEIQSGRLKVLLPGEPNWRDYCAGESFRVKAHAIFKLDVSEIVDYCCSFVS